MPETVTISTTRAQPGMLARMRQALRAYWTGTFSLKDPALNALYGVGSRTLAGPMVTEFTAFTCAAFWDGVNQISSDVAKQPLDLKIRDEKGGSKDFIGSKTYKLMKYSPNPYTRSFVFRRTLTAHALVHGSGYAEIVRDQVNRPAALYILQPWRVRPEMRGNTLVYVVDGDTENPLPAGDVLHIQGPGDDGISGWNVVNVAREAIGLALASQRFAAAFFGNGTRFGGVLSTEQDLDYEQKEGIRKQINDMHAKADKAFRLLILGGGFTYTPTGIKPSEAQMKEMREQQVVEIARYLNMPPHKLKELSRATFSNIEHQDLEYYKGPILTWDTIWEEELNAKLVPPLEQGRQYFKHNANVFLRGDIKSRYEALGIARDKGIISADEWRALEDMNPQPDGQGKLYLVQAAQIPVNKLSDLVDAQIAETKAGAQPTATDADVQRAEARAERAEQLAAEAQAQALSLREQIKVVEGVGTAREGEIDTLKTALDKQQRLATDLTVLATEARGEADILREQKDALVHRAHTLEDEKIALGLKLAELRESVEQATARRDVADRDAQEARANEAAARALAEESEAAAREARQEAEANDTENADLTKKLAEAEELAAYAKEVAEDATTRRAEAEQAVQEAVGEMNRANAEIERLTAASQQDREALEQQIALMESTLSQTQTSHQVELEALKQTVLRYEQEQAAIQADRDALLARAERAEAERKERLIAEEAARAEVETARQQWAELARLADEAGAAAENANTRAELEAAAKLDAEQRAEAAETARKTQREADLQHRSLLLAGHRALVVDAMGRMVRRESEQARKRQATPEKLRSWLATFDALHAEICVEALLPAVRVHLAWKQSGDDPHAATTALVNQHLQDFRSKVLSVVDGDSEDFHAVLAKTLERWERDEPEQIADGLMRDAIAHLRATGQE